MGRLFDSRDLHRLRGDSDAPPRPGEGDDPLVGQLVADRYRVVRRLDEGAQATIYLARHTFIKRTVALKVLTPQMTANSDLVRRFLDEGQVAGTMGHPNIVESLDMGVTDDGRPFLVLEYLEGRTIARELDVCGAFDVGRAAFLGSQIASALAAAHERGIVHRDLKPENVFLVERDGRPDHVKVLDFGISKFVARDTTVDAWSSLVVGTPEYMAPEQVTSPTSVDARADVYALGAMLYEMLSGRTALGPDTDNLSVSEVLTRIVESTPPPLAQLRSGLPPRLVAAIERAMEKDRTRRPAKIAELKTELDAFAVVSVSRSAHVTVQVPPSPPMTSVSATPLARPTLATSSSPKTKLGLALGALLVGLVVVGLVATRTLMRPKALASTSDRASSGATTLPVSEPTSLPPSTGEPLPGASESSPGALATGPASAGNTAPKGSPTRRAGAVAMAPTASASARTLTDAVPAPESVAPPPTPAQVAAPPAALPVAASAAPPVPVAASTVAPGTIEPRAVNGAVRAHSGQVQACFDRARMGNADLRGRVVVRASVDPTGAVVSASVARTTANDTHLENCLVSAFRTWTFPPPSGGVAGAVTYTFVFE